MNPCPACTRKRAQVPLYPEHSGPLIRHGTYSSPHIMRLRRRLIRRKTGCFKFISCFTGLSLKVMWKRSIPNAHFRLFKLIFIRKDNNESLKRRKQGSPPIVRRPGICRGASVMPATSSKRSRPCSQSPLICSLSLPGSFSLLKGDPLRQPSYPLGKTNRPCMDLCSCRINYNHPTDSVKPQMPLWVIPDDFGLGRHQGIPQQGSLCPTILFRRKIGNDDQRECPRAPTHDHRKAKASYRLRRCPPPISQPRLKKSALLAKLGYVLIMQKRA